MRVTIINLPFLASPNGEPFSAQRATDQKDEQGNPVTESYTPTLADCLLGGLRMLPFNRLSVDDATRLWDATRACQEAEGKDEIVLDEPVFKWLRETLFSAKSAAELLVDQQGKPRTKGNVAVTGFGLLGVAMERAVDNMQPADITPLKRVE